MRVRKILKNERGSLSIEFLGILPFYFLFFLLLWQIVASGYAVLNLKSIASDAAQVYAMSEDYAETKEVIDKSIEGGELLKNQSFVINRDAGTNLFVVNITASHPLVFLPNSWKEKTLITINAKATGKVLAP
jgi:hypothetical protein